MRVALLAANGVYAALVEEHVSLTAGAGLEVVWTVDQPSQVLAALDHHPDLFLLDMQFRDEALQAGVVLKEAGIDRVICLFDNPDDLLLPVASILGLEAALRGMPWPELIACMQATV